MQNFMQIPPRVASRQMGEIYAKIFLAIYFFSETHLQVRPFGRFLHAMAQTTRSRVFWRLKILKLIFNVFIQKFKKITMGPMGKIKQLLKRS